MSVNKKILALMLAALMLMGLLQLAGCRRGDDPEPAPTQPASGEEADEAWILILAETFAGFGDYDSQKGFRLSESERLLACRYRSHLEESEIPGYGRVSFAEAEAELKRILGINELGTTLHTPRKNEDQEIFAENEAYYIRLYEPEYEMSLASAEPVRDDSPEGRTFAKVEARKDGELQFTMDLLLYRAESGEYYVRSAGKYLVR